MTLQHARFSLFAFLFLFLLPSYAHSGTSLCEATLYVAAKYSDLAKETLQLRRDRPEGFHMAGRPSSIAELRFMNILIEENPGSVIEMMLASDPHGAPILNPYAVRFRAAVLRDFQNRAEMDIRAGAKSLLIRIIVDTSPLEDEEVLNYLARVHSTFRGALDKQKGTTYKLERDDDEFIPMKCLNQEYKSKALGSHFEEEFFANTVFDRFLNFEMGAPSVWNIFNPTYLLLAELRSGHPEAFSRLTTY